MNWSWVLAFAGFATLIVLHEFGHFVAAKATGMRVERFFLFFPPAVAKVRRGETEYGIGAVPLGGFVKITGMNPEEELPPEVAPRAYYRQPVWKRVVVILAGPAMNLAIAFVVLFFVLLSVPAGTQRVDEVTPGSPAQGKLRPGDRVVSVDGERENPAEMLRAIQEHRCPGGATDDGCRAESAAEVVIARDGRRVRLHIRPYYDAQVRQQRLGITYARSQRTISNPPPEAAGRSVELMWRVTTTTLGVIVRIFDPEQREQISGVVGGYEVTRQAFEFDTEQAMLLIGIISLSLAIINLFPFLPLDGGHVFWSLVEKVRGRPTPFSVMERAGVVGFVLVIMLFFVGLSNDIGRLTGEGFDVR